MQKSQFKNWKSRASSLGHLLTKVENITSKQKEVIKTLTKEKETGTNANGNKIKWSISKETKLKSLIAQRDKTDQLPAGVKTHLDNVFRSQFWGRHRLLFNKYMDKGNLAEEDSLDLVSKLDGFFYAKNEIQFENSFITGTPDNIQQRVKDTKTNYDMESFDKAELTSLYTWQVKGYIYLLLYNKENPLKSWRGELVYCLVNNPVSQLINDKTSLYYKMGTPDDDDELFMEAKCQIERNMIFDIEKWQENYPNYQLENTILNFDVPALLRVKRYDVILRTKDIKFIKQRVKMARIYLMEKEQEVLNKLKHYVK